MIYEGCKNLIVTIVKKGWSEKVIHASREAGASGGTILMGRGYRYSRDPVTVRASHRTRKGSNSDGSGSGPD